MSEEYWEIKLAPKRKSAKKPKNKSWSKTEIYLFPSVLTDMEGRDKPWAFVLETLALKKTTNEIIFTKISEELEAKLVANGVSSSKEDKSFTIEQLRTKFKWFKKEWKRINYKIQHGSGLGADDTKLPDWYDLLDPIFTEIIG